MRVSGRYREKFACQWFDLMTVATLPVCRRVRGRGLFAAMMFDVFAVACKQLQILRTIVVFHAVDVVNHFIRQQQATKYLLHHQSMLKNSLRVLGSIRMIRRIDLDITVTGASAPAFPADMLWTSAVNRDEPRSTFLRLGFTRHRTESASDSVRLFDLERFAAGRTDDNGSSHDALPESVDWRGSRALLNTAA